MLKGSSIFSHETTSCSTSRVKPRPRPRDPPSSGWPGCHYLFIICSSLRRSTIPSLSNPFQLSAFPCSMLAQGFWLVASRIRPLLSPAPLTTRTRHELDPRLSSFGKRPETSIRPLSAVSLLQISSDQTGQAISQLNSPPQQPPVQLFPIVRRPGNLLLRATRRTPSAPMLLAHAA